MENGQYRWDPTDGWSPGLPRGPGRAQLVLAFGPSSSAASIERDEALRSAFPDAIHVFCAGGGQISGTEVVDDSTVVTAITFAHSAVSGVCREHGEGEDSAVVGEDLARALPRDGLRHALVFCDGLGVNASALVRGMSAVLPPAVAITGGLAADGERFQRTPVGLGHGSPGPARAGSVAAIGLHGDALRIGMGTLGGWDVFGPERLITRSAGNVLYELDGEPALRLYRRYLGPFASELPASALLFPLRLRCTRGAGALEDGVVRTILGIDEDEGSMTFGGDMPEGAYARLMRANVDRLIDGATGAARIARPVDPATRGLAVLISCVGRRWVLRQRVEEEIESARAVLGPTFTLTGFYSYGEIAPMRPEARCELHNQTMTITTIEERLT